MIEKHSMPRWIIINRDGEFPFAVYALNQDGKTYRPFTSNYLMTVDEAQAHAEMAIGPQFE